MDFVVGLPKTQADVDSIWVIVDSLTKFSHFLPVKGAFGTQLRLSTAYDPQNDRQTERTIQTLEGILGLAPYEELYGKRCQTPTYWSEVGDLELFGLDFVQDTTQQILKIREKLKQAHIWQKSYYDNKHRPLEFNEGEYVFVKLSPKLGRVGPITYRLALPPNLADIHDMFHESLLRRYIAYASHIVQLDDVEVRENLKTPVGPLKILDHSEKKLRNKTIAIVKVQWEYRTPEECTWERDDELL
ncbi:uncharacterized protein LOC133305145 [Gastrolobium bilobum]|uniref:uncharacterized protein LOC133305145 n=1 Tax=Gastrolobium bilobum TaxID=150636 RepID=UPI002AB00E39|nr:uncharacterized protein LOC133305145 [Gastrolobium bilobum]